MRHSLWFSSLSALAFLAMAMPGAATVKTEKVEYEASGNKFVGYLSYDDAVVSGTAKVPAVVVFPEWWGNNDYSQRRAKEMAEQGYVALAADVYGGGLVAKDRSEAASLATPLFQNRTLLRDRANAALKVLTNHKNVDTKRIGAMGYCLGGTTSLELARSGAPVAAVTSFHGGLGFPDAITTGTRSIPVLILTGADDPMIPASAVEKAKEEFTQAKFPTEVISYPGVVHSFTNPAAGSNKASGGAYDEKADKDSNSRMLRFFSEVLKKEGR